MNEQEREQFNAMAQNIARLTQVLMPPPIKTELTREEEIQQMSAERRLRFQKKLQKTKQ